MRELISNYVRLNGGMRVIEKILVANNGIAAVKGIRSIRKWSYETFGFDHVFKFIVMATPEDLASEAEYIKLADKFIEVEGGSNIHNYANIDLIVETAEQTKCDAVWAGWGHASENPQLPEALSKAGIIWIGPTPEAMKALGDKIGSTLIAQSSGMKVLPWNGEGLFVDYKKEKIKKETYDKACLKHPQEARHFAEKIGLPVMIKASEGGGGKGIRKLENIEKVEEAFRQVTSEVSGPVFIMKLVKNCRHLEVQVIADESGNAIALFGRDCSLQRRHQKIIEEGPVSNEVCPGEKWDEMERAAVKLCKEVGYVGAGTVEYLYSEDDGYCFLELNPRLQVEHPVTELISGVNLPATQVLIAMGVRLHRIPTIRTLYGFSRFGDEAIDFSTTPKAKRKLPHVIACRITAENPETDFTPTSGLIHSLYFRSTQDVWGYFSVVSKGSLHEFADSQFGHLFAIGCDREAARKKMVLALSELLIQGEIRTTVEYLRRILETKDFVNNKLSTSWLEKKTRNKFSDHLDVYTCVVAAALFKAFFHFEQSRKNFIQNLEKGRYFFSEKTLESQISFPVEIIKNSTKFRFIVQKRSKEMFSIAVPCSDCSEVSKDPNLQSNSQRWRAKVKVKKSTDGGLLMAFNGVTHVIYGNETPSGLSLMINGCTRLFENERDPSSIRATIPGKLLRFLVEENDFVKKGTVFAEVEVMKIVIPLVAEENGIISPCVPEGSIISTGDVVAKFEMELDKSVQPKTKKYKGEFPHFLPPDPEKTKANRVLEQSIKTCKGVLNGFQVQNIQHEVELLFQYLHDPKLPFLELGECLFNLRKRIPRTLYKSLKDVLKRGIAKIKSMTYGEVESQSDVSFETKRSDVERSYSYSDSDQKRQIQSRSECPTSQCPQPFEVDTEMTKATKMTKNAKKAKKAKTINSKTERHKENNEKFKNLSKTIVFEKSENTNLSETKTLEKAFLKNKEEVLYLNEFKNIIETYRLQLDVGSRKEFDKVSDKLGCLLHKYRKGSLNYGIMIIKDILQEYLAVEKLFENDPPDIVLSKICKVKGIKTDYEHVYNTAISHHCIRNKNALIMCVLDNVENRFERSETSELEDVLALMSQLKSNSEIVLKCRKILLMMKYQHFQSQQHATEKVKTPSDEVEKLLGIDCFKGYEKIIIGKIDNTFLYKLVSLTDKNYLTLSIRSIMDNVVSVDSVKAEIIKNLDAFEIIINGDFGRSIENSLFIRISNVDFFSEKDSDNFIKTLSKNAKKVLNENKSTVKLLKLTNVEIKFSSFLLRFNNVTGYCWEVRFSEAANVNRNKELLFSPNATLYNKRQLSKSLNTLYVHDFKILIKHALKKIWKETCSNYIVEGEFEEPKITEFFLVKSLVNGKTKLKMGSETNVTESKRTSCGIVVWELEFRSPGSSSQTRKVIIVANDITFLYGSTSIDESALFCIAVKHARKRKIPLFFIASNSGARIGLSDEVWNIVRISKRKDKCKKEIEYLYIHPSDFQEVKEFVKVTNVFNEEENCVVFKIEAIYGKRNGLNVENLSASGAMASEMASAYNETFTLSYVTGRSVGIGAYLVRLGHRIVQKKDSPILLTGFNALNNILGDSVYSSNLQIGGPKIMSPCGITHSVVKDDFEGILECLRWICFLPQVSCSLDSLFGLERLRLKNKDPVARKLNDSDQTNIVKNDSLCEDESSDPESKNPLSLYFSIFDKKSFKEYQSDWAKSVVVGRARLGGIPVGVICPQSKKTEKVVPADPSVIESREMVYQQAGQVWFPDSSFKTATAIDNMNKEGLPLFILANWRGFSGGMRDMFDEILKYGSEIVYSLKRYNHPVFVYLPYKAELRGGAWVVLDSMINPEFIETYASENSRGSVLEPEGTIQVKLRKNKILSLAGRLDVQLSSLTDKLDCLKRGINSENLKIERSKNEEKPKIVLSDEQSMIHERDIRKKILKREEEVFQFYRKSAIEFADLHDRPERMLKKGVVKNILPFEDARRFFFYRLRVRILIIGMTQKIKQTLMKKSFKHCKKQLDVFLKSRGIMVNNLDDKCCFEKLVIEKDLFVEYLKLLRKKLFFDTDETDFE